MAPVQSKKSPLVSAVSAAVTARMPAALALAVAALVGAVLCLLHAIGRAKRGLVVAAAIYALVLVGGTAYATFIQRFVVAPNEQARETPYILHNIEATRQGFALDRIEVLREHAAIAPGEGEMTHGSDEDD